ncbi:phage portal protein, lambda family [Paracoccus thiocyanatus]|uniref:Phage portal protein, lambda family n=1 Tax=Paracoccus thiocyanatus TaxID=34006 RepID=A0A1N6Y2D8_9RHOB|nr:phage portal protein [Paracoccus thiocyanatus]SIR08694.1 phage portal protein, lambda family [Paracoccus thiocyanatus]
MAKPTDTTPDVRWGMMDAALATVAPRSAARRYAARVAISNLRRGYEAAARGRGTSGWQAGSTSADAEISSAGAALRDRMRDLVRNNPIAAQAVQVLVNNIVGTGIRPRAATADPVLNKQVDDLWRAWAARCDQHGHTDFHGVLGLAVRQMIEGGEVFAIARPVPRAERGRGVPLRIELREADHLDGARFESRADGSRIDQGIEYDRNGRRTGYWMFPDHPGSRSPVFARRLESVRVAGDQVAHLFERQRVQSRGVPWGAPAMRAIRDVDDWQHAELVRKKTEACLVGIVFGADEDQQSIAPVIEDSMGNRVEQFEPGLIAYARGGKDIKFNQPTSTAGVYEWHRTQLHIIAAGFRVPYSMMTGDLSQANFSSTRAGLNEFRRMVEQIQWQTVIPMFCEPIWRWFIDAAQIQGLLPDDGEILAEWGTPKFESVNPLQDAQADLLEVRAGFSTLPQQIARRGYDPAEIITEWADFAKKADAAGLVFDSDPRKVTKAGLVQSADPTAPGADNQE